jgi:hypothetical protein
MTKQGLFCAALVVFAAGASDSGDTRPLEPVVQDSMESAVQTVRIPGTTFEIIVGVTTIGRESASINAELVVAIADWLSSNYDLPAIYDPPVIKLVPAAMMATLRHRDVSSDAWSDSQASTGYLEASQTSSTIVAIYDDRARTIYLPETWTGDTPVALSVLVHEMVHHLQNLAGMTFACPEAREKLAYAAQQDWLALFGRDIFTEFETDPLTLLVRTECSF